jgi:hypothetical protein
MDRNMKYLALSLILILTGCVVGPEYPLEREGTWQAVTVGGSMDLPSVVTMTYDWNAVSKGDICAYVWHGNTIIHRVHGEIKGGWTMKGDFNLHADAGVMTRGNYVGTVIEK